MIEGYYTGSTIKHLTGDSLNSILFPLPPTKEQLRIVDEVETWESVMDILIKEGDELSSAILQVKSRILDLAIHGKLVPQDPNDEPAIELLKRINPKFIPCDNAHYGNVPSGWTFCRLEDIVEYEQPQEYIVQSTEYNPQYKTPVLTAGKSFIIGYTDETEGVFNDLPVIIFDDFTTYSKYVDFPFKVKSSAMKILHVKEGINIQYVCQFMSITRLIGDTHKRYWISEYSKIVIPVPPREEQDRIINKVIELYQILDSISAEL
jgi:type I restriction enzyme S subunit